MASGSLPNVIRFPRNKKRGAKVSKGPQATVLTLPLPLTGDALKSRWAWMRFYATHWDHEEIEGNWDDDPLEWESAVRMGRAYAGIDDQQFNEEYMRRDIERGCEMIRTRIAIKDWLETLGVNWKTVRGPEQALHFVFDHLQGSRPRA